MSKFGFIVLCFSVYSFYTWKNSLEGAGKLNHAVIYGRWATASDSTWFELYYNGTALGKYDGEEFNGSYQELAPGDFNVRRTRRGAGLMVFLRDERLVVLGQYGDLKLEKKEDFVPGMQKW